MNKLVKKLSAAARALCAGWLVASSEVAGQTLTEKSFDTIAVFKKKLISGGYSNFTVIEGKTIASGKSGISPVVLLEKELRKNNASIPSKDFMESFGEQAEQIDACVFFTEDGVPTLEFTKESSKKEAVLITSYINEEGLSWAINYLPYKIRENKNNANIDFGIFTTDRISAAENFHEIGHLATFKYLKKIYTDGVSPLEAVCAYKNLSENAADAYEVLKMAAHDEIDFLREKAKLYSLYCAFTSLEEYEQSHDIAGLGKFQGAVYNTFESRKLALELAINMASAKESGVGTNKSVLASRSKVVKILDKILKAHFGEDDEEVDTMNKEISEYLFDSGLGANEDYLGMLGSFIASACSPTPKQTQAVMLYIKGGSIKGADREMLKKTGNNLSSKQLDYLEKFLATSEEALNPHPNASASRSKKRSMTPANSCPKAIGQYPQANR